MCKPRQRVECCLLPALVSVILFSVWEPKSANAQIPPVLSKMDCDGSETFRDWRFHAMMHGPDNPNVIRFAIEIWRQTDWSNIGPLMHGEAANFKVTPDGRDDENLGQLRWRSEHFADGALSRYLQIVVPMVAAHLHGGEVAQKWLDELASKFGWEEADCYTPVSPFTFLLLQYSLVCGFKKAGNPQMLDTFKSQAMASMELLLDLPFHTYDLLDLSLNLSSFTVGINLNADDRIYRTFAEYERANPVPKPYLPHWSAEILEKSELGSLQSHRRFLRTVQTRGQRPVRVAMLHLHDATAWDDWHSLRAAWLSMQDGGNVNRLQPLFYFTRIMGLRGCPEQIFIEANLRAPFQSLKGMLNIARLTEQYSKNLGVATDFLNLWWEEGQPAMRDAEIILCGEPVWLCPLLGRISGDRPMLIRFNMAILDEFTFGNGIPTPVLGEWWEELRGFISRGGFQFTSVGTRYTVEQVAYQTGGAIRLPYVPFLGLPVDPQFSSLAKREPRGHSLLFQTNLPPILSFKRVLKLFAAWVAPGVVLVDMNDLPKGVCRTEMAAYEAAILLPHNPAPIRLIDLYSQGVVLFVPGEPLIHKWIWANRPFGGFDGMTLYRAMAPIAFPNTSSTKPPEGHPPFSATAYIANWAIPPYMQARRYWLQYSEWEVVPALRRFQGIPDLVEQLNTLESSNVEWTKEAMGVYLQARRADALAWWRAGLAEVFPAGVSA